MPETAILINGVQVNDDLYFSIDWQKSRGLFSPAMRKRATSRPTLDGDLVNAPGVRAYNPRMISLAIEAVNCGSFTAVREAMARLAQAISTRPALLQIGSLQCRANFYLVEEEDGPEKTLPDRAWCTIEGEVIPGTWDGAYGYAVGVDQGIPVIDDRLDRAELMMTDITGNGRVFSFTNPGTAATELALMISVTPVPADLNIWIRCTHRDAPVRVKARFDASGLLYVAPSKGLLLPADTAAVVYRLEQDDGSLIGAGTFKAAIVASAMRWRFLGNDGDLMGEGPAAISHYRRGVATARNSTTLATFGDMACRIGLPWWTYSGVAAVPDFAYAGAVFEQTATNLCQYSQNFTAAGWTTSNATVVNNTTTGPDGTTTAATLTATGADGYLVYDTGISGINGSTYTASLFVRAAVPITSKLYVTDNVSQGFGQTVAVTDSVKRVSVTGAFTGASSTLKILIKPQEGGTGEIYIWGAQVETGPIATSYIPTAGSIVIRHADYAALCRGHNYVPVSENFGSSLWVKDVGNLTVTAASVAGPNGVATGSKVEKTATVNGRMYVASTSYPHDKAVFAIKAKAGTISTISLGIYDATLGSWLVNPATAANQFALGSTFETPFVAATVVPGHDINFYYYVDAPGNAAAGYIYVTAAQGNEGTVPGPYVYTDGSAVPLPDSGFDFPGGLEQNIVVEFDYVAPTNSAPTGLAFTILGAEADITTPSLTLNRRAAIGAGVNTTDFINLHNGTTGTDTAGQHRTSPAAAIYTGAPVTIKLVRVNYEVTVGAVTTRYMYARVYVGGTLVSVDENVAAVHGATAWAALERLWLSKGSTCGTIRRAANGNPLFRAPAIGTDIPSGAVPAT